MTEKIIGVNHTGLKIELNKIALDDLFVEATALKLFFKERLYIVQNQLEELVNCNQAGKSSSHISSLREEMSTSEKKIERKS